MELNLIEKSTSEIISLKEAKNYLRVDHDFDDCLISGMIRATRDAIEALIQKSILQQKFEYIILNRAMCNFDFFEERYPSILGQFMRIPLPKPPIISIDTVFVDNNEVEPRKYTLEKLSNSFCVCINTKKIKNMNNNSVIKIIYNAGLALSPAEVPYQLKLANLMLTANAYQVRFFYKNNTDISVGVKQLLSPFLSLRIF